MPTEIFTRTQFEDALPKDTWYKLDEFGEYSYEIPVFDCDTDISMGVSIVICSSIPRGADVCSSTGKNSIRHWLVDYETRNPAAPKLKEYTARTLNWRKNMLQALRDLYKVGLALGPCPKCRNTAYDGAKLSVRISKSIKNPGRMFIGCGTYKPEYKCDYFKWLDEEVTDL